MGEQEDDLPHIVWDTGNLRHLRDHGRCRAWEVEEVVNARCHAARRQRIDVAEGEPVKWEYFGQSCAGRFLVVIAEAVTAGIRPITCWPLVGRQRTRYLGWRRTRKAV
jgi:hypothetical protein